MPGPVDPPTSVDETVPLQPVVTSATPNDEFPLRLGSAEVLLVPSVPEPRGSLTHAEHPTDLPFLPARYFLVYDVPAHEVRGLHAHQTCAELLVCVSGEVTVAIDDGTDQGEVVLDRRDVALHLPPMVWSRQHRYSPDAVLLVLAADRYDPDGYVRDHQEFLALVAGSDTTGG